MNIMNDNDLKSLLAKMLPEQLTYFPHGALRSVGVLRWWPSRNGGGINGAEVLDTELLHLCSLVEAGLTEEERETVVTRIVEQMPKFPKCNPFNEARFTTFATWQQRVTALAAVKGVAL
jgi:hypothetical protein